MRKALPIVLTLVIGVFSLMAYFVPHRAISNLQQHLADWIPVHIDVDEQPEVQRRYSVAAQPTLFVLSPKGKPLARFEGTMPAQTFLQFLQSSAKRYRQGSSPST